MASSSSCKVEPPNVVATHHCCYYSLVKGCNHDIRFQQQHVGSLLLVQACNTSTYWFGSAAGGAEKQPPAHQCGMHAGGVQARGGAPPLSAGLHQHCRQLLPAWGPAQDGSPGAAVPGIPHQLPHIPYLPVAVPPRRTVISKVPSPCCLPDGEPHCMTAFPALHSLHWSTSLTHC